MNRKEKITSTYREFCLAEGNQHISSEYAVHKIQELLESFKVQRILEVGLGIGAIAGSLLAVNKELTYAGTEDNNFCLKALEQNLGQHYRRIKLYPGIADIDKSSRFELIIVDGKDYGLIKVTRLITQNGIIAIEGDRLEQLKELEHLFPNHIYAHSISRTKNKNYSPFPSNQWQGGIKLIFINPTLSQTLWCMRERVTTKLKYLIYR